MSETGLTPELGGGGVRRLRHALADRLFHWLSAISVSTLLITALLPVLGVDFPWVTIHWTTGVALAVLVLVHILRATFWQGLATMWIGSRDIRDLGTDLRAVIERSSRRAKIGGKYSLAQKLIHHAFAVVLLTAIVTGCLMLVKIDTPWWERDPYWLGDTAWGVIYILHDLASFCLITMVTVHIYFALRPEKLHLTRSMLAGWITAAEYEKNYDTSRWHAERQ